MPSRSIDSPVGPITLTSTGDGLSRIELREPASDRGTAGDCTHLDAAQRWFEAHFDGRDCPIPELDDSAMSPFAKAVCTTLMRIAPTGSTTTYGELAAAAGHPGAARAVGSVMASQPWPILVPCHRVLRSDGALGAYSAGEGVATKRLLIEFES